MKVRPYLHVGTYSSTLTQIERLVETVTPEEALFCFAYATLSGCAEFQRRLGDSFWQQTKTRWLVGIDYGRTEPAALEFLSHKENAEVRIHDGAVVINSEGLVPIRDYHMKACFLKATKETDFGMLVGSGNFTRSGLINNVECSIAAVTTNNDEYQKIMKAPFDGAEVLWNAGESLESVLAQYKEVWKPASLTWTRMNRKAANVNQPTTNISGLMLAM